MLSTTLEFGMQNVLKQEYQKFVRFPTWTYLEGSQLVADQLERQHEQDWLKSANWRLSREAAPMATRLSDRFLRSGRFLAMPMGSDNELKIRTQLANLFALVARTFKSH